MFYADVYVNGDIIVLVTPGKNKNSIYIHLFDKTQSIKAWPLIKFLVDDMDEKKRSDYFDVPKYTKYILQSEVREELLKKLPKDELDKYLYIY